MSEFQSILRSLRIASGLTQDELSAKIGVSRSSVGMYERGARNPDKETMEAIADFFNVDMDYLYGRASKTTFLPETIPERKMLEKFRKLDPADQDYIRSLIDRLSGEKSESGVDAVCG